MTDPVVQVGCRALDVTDHVQGARVPVHVLYPTIAPTRTETFGPYSLDVALDGQAAFPASQDPPGFDRAAYQPHLCADVLAFLRATAGGGNHEHLPRADGPFRG